MAKNVAKGRRKGKGYYRIRGKVPVISENWNNYYERDLNLDGSLNREKPKAAQEPEGPLFSHKEG